MQENLTILLTSKHDKKDHKLHDEYLLYMPGDWKLINNHRPEIKTGF